MSNANMKSEWKRSYKPLSEYRFSGKVGKVMDKVPEEMLLMLSLKGKKQLIKWIRIKSILPGDTAYA